MDRRSLLWMTGVGALAAAVGAPDARAQPAPMNTGVGRVPPPAAPAGAPEGAYIFQDEFDGPAGQGPDPSKWTVQTWQDDIFPPIEGQYRAQNVYLDGNSNLVLVATEEMGNYYSGNLLGNWRGLIGTTWEARVKLDCLSPGLWPSFWAVNEDPEPDGEVDIFEWYGNGDWPAGATVHAASNGKTWEGKSIPGLVDGGWHTWRMGWYEDGFHFWRDGAPYFSVPPNPIHVYGGDPDDFRWPFNDPGYWLSPRFTLAVGGPGAGDPALGTFPAAMLVDYFRVW